MAGKTPKVIELPGPNPVEHVESILAAPPAAPPPDPIPHITSESALLTEMLDNIDGPPTDDVFAEIDRKLVEHQTLGPKDEVKLPPPPPRNSPRDATPKAPKEAIPASYEAATPRRRRRSSGGNDSATTIGIPAATPAIPTSLGPEHIASLLQMAHAVGSTVLGPSFLLDKQSAEAIGAAAIPVLDDFGVVVAGKIVHVMMLVATVGMIEGPIFAGVWLEMRRRAEARMPGATAMTAGAPVRQAEPSFADLVSAATGVQVGNAPE